MHVQHGYCVVFSKFARFFLVETESHLREVRGALFVAAESDIVLLAVLSEIEMYDNFCIKYNFITYEYT